MIEVIDQIQQLFLKYQGLIMPFLTGFVGFILGVVSHIIKSNIDLNNTKHSKLFDQKLIISQTLSKYLSELDVLIHRYVYSVRSNPDFISAGFEITSKTYETAESFFHANKLLIKNKNLEANMNQLFSRYNQYIHSLKQVGSYPGYLDNAKQMAYDSLWVKYDNELLTIIPDLRKKIDEHLLNMMK